ncbi:MAG TPA: ATP-binding protein [Candidatus Paceibacterota bacterium]|nr:ATP-binding protein [Candidatus Paceibacterota bacterium]
MNRDGILADMEGVHESRRSGFWQWTLAAVLVAAVFVSVIWLVEFVDSERGHDYFHQHQTQIKIVIIAVGVVSGIVFAALVLSIYGSRERAERLSGRLTGELEAVARALARKNEELEQRVTERTAELSRKATEAGQSRSALLNVLEDLTKAKRELESARAYDRALMRSMADGVIAVDRGGTITLMNAAAEHILGIKAQDAIGKEITTIVVKVDDQGIPIPREQRLHVQVMEKGKPDLVFHDDRHSYVRTAGSSFPVAEDVAPIVEDDRIIGSISSFRDITEQRQIERTKDEFVSLASHELRTPLTGIGWYAELLQDEKNGKLTPTQREYLKEILESNRRMSSLVDSLLNVSRLELDTFSVEPEVVHVAVLMKDVLGGYIAPIEEKRLNVLEEYDPFVGDMVLDPRLLTIIAQNLISNAVKYTPVEGTVTIRLRPERDSVVLEVSDTGIGIPSDARKNIFKKLFRADNARLLDPEGSGLGLYMVHTLIEHIGGDISFVSEPEKGTTFTVRLPRTGMVPQKGQQQLIIGSARF